MGKDIYGFVLWLSGIGLWIGYFVWAFVPDEVLKSDLGVTWYPSKYWAVALPVHVCVSLLAASLIYTCYNMTTVADRNDLCTVQDPCSITKTKGTQSETKPKDSVFDLDKDTPIIHDLSPEQSSFLLFSVQHSS
uniref:PIG-P domain-containing protein n=1 Tax=Aplanochytrium stocchinoi TaxID=215587 RepID=A0A7S3LQX8_9STRA|mmetsp:Transcript_3247/g.4117  ORF Transcript_3247/g.4117 Transcript_3247/m.4117 type:complete len:134 (+) Transcript_3247:209-610(+)